MRAARRPIVLAGARTPFAKAFGALASVPAKVLAAAAMREAIARAAIEASEIDAVLLGNVAGPADAPNIARVAALLAGIPERVPAVTVNRNCASGLEAIAQGAALVRDGEAEVVVAGGAESMSSVPFFFRDETRAIYLAASRAKRPADRFLAFARLRPRHFKPVPGLELGLVDPCCGLSMGETAEVLSATYEIGRAEQDAYALESHRRAIAASASGKTGEEIAPVFAPEARDGSSRGRLVDADVGPRAEQTIEALARLRPVFDRRGGSVTAGNASPITDGAAAVVITTEERAARASLPSGPLGALRSWAAVGLSPRTMGLGPVYAIPAALSRAGTAVGAIDLVEINEAFAAQVLACQRAMASPEFCREELGLDAPLGAVPADRLNVNGGAIALGHPVGASGARLVVTILHEMRRRRARLGLVSLCVGGGQGMAAVVEAP